VKDAESDIYETLREDHSEDRCRKHTSEADQSGLEGVFSIDPAEKASENLLIAKGAAQGAKGNAKEDLDSIVAQLEELMQARSAIFEAKTFLAEEFNTKVREDEASASDLADFRTRRDSFTGAASNVSGSESVYVQQV